MQYASRSGYYLKVLILALQLRSRPFFDEKSDTNPWRNRKNEDHEAGNEADWACQRLTHLDLNY
jgi:hypothetical protein